MNRASFVDVAVHIIHCKLLLILLTEHSRAASVPHDRSVPANRSTYAYYTRIRVRNWRADGERTCLCLRLSHLVPRWRTFQHAVITKICYDTCIKSWKNWSWDLILLKVPDNERSVLLLVSNFIKKKKKKKKKKLKRTLVTDRLERHETERVKIRSRTLDSDRF